MVEKRLQGGEVVDVAEEASVVSGLEKLLISIMQLWMTNSIIKLNIKISFRFKLYSGSRLMWSNLKIPFTKEQ